jgi:alkylhydroperoxidase family enzyme
MTVTPTSVTDSLVAQLREHLSERQLVELTSYIALENSRARFNTALGIDNQGFSAGSCAVPQPVATSAR